VLDGMAYPEFKFVMLDIFSDLSLVLERALNIAQKSTKISLVYVTFS
jgi:hypothetical protein